MKRFLTYISISVLTGILLVFLCLWGILVVSPGYEDTYQGVIRTKFDHLVETKNPKIILISGSSSAFGLDQKLLEEKTGYPVCNLGLHAGFRALFPTELSKANIGEGDIVLCAYEYLLGDPKEFTTIGDDLVLSGVGTKWEMYRYVPKDQWPGLLGYLFQYAAGKSAYVPDEGVYNGHSFDPVTGQFLPVVEDVMHYGVDSKRTLELDELTLCDETQQYLVAYRDYVESRGAQIYFVGAPLLNEAIRFEPSELDGYQQMVEEKTGIHYISRLQDYLLPSDMLFDSIWHTNHKGMEKRTELLAEDLAKAGLTK